MTMETRLALDVIDTLLISSSPNVAKEIWDVLASLRGPDGPGPGPGLLKTHTTAVIRAKAFPRWAADSHRSSFPNSFFARRGGAEVNIQQDSVSDPGFGHFAAHVRKAAKVLGLTVEGDPEDSSK